jgi:hypothetical protein
MSVHAGPNVVENGLVLALDAANPKSYPGTGTTWFDLTPNKYDFTINAGAYSTSGVPHMNFEGTFFAAKRIVGGALTNVPNFSTATIMVFTSILNSTSNWRTLIRGAVDATGDHQVIIQSGSNTLGMYDSSSGQFISSGFSITSLPNPYTQFNCLTFRLAQSSPFYQFQFNNDPTVYSITNTNSTFNNGFAAIGAYHNGNTSMTSFDQYWGKISSFYYFNRHLTQAEIQQNYNAIRSRFGI